LEVRGNDGLAIPVAGVSPYALSSRLVVTVCEPAVICAATPNGRSPVDRKPARCANDAEPHDWLTQPLDPETTSSYDSPADRRRAAWAITSTDDR
jgi:hypothetical protein